MPPRLARCLDQLCITADVSELAAFYRGLPLYPEPPRYLARATEGLRTNMKNVFESIAHRNPYPSEQFPEAAWNQMVLKALFVGSALWPIVGLDARANPALARMLQRLCARALGREPAGEPGAVALRRAARRRARRCRTWKRCSSKEPSRSARPPRWRCALLRMRPPRRCCNAIRVWPSWRARVSSLGRTAG